MKTRLLIPILLMFLASILFSHAGVLASPQSPCIRQQEKGQEGQILQEEIQILSLKLDTPYKGMPREELLILGFSKDEMLDYYTYDNLEFMVFSDPTTVSFEDIVTFIVEDGKVIDWFRGYRGDVLKTRM